MSCDTFFLVHTPANPLSCEILEKCPPNRHGSQAAVGGPTPGHGRGGPGRGPGRGLDPGLGSSPRTIVEKSEKSKFQEFSEWACL